MDCAGGSRMWTNHGFQRWLRWCSASRCSCGARHRRGNHEESYNAGRLLDRMRFWLWLRETGYGVAFGSTDEQLLSLTPSVKDQDRLLR